MNAWHETGTCATLRFSLQGALAAWSLLWVRSLTRDVTQEVSLKRT